MTVDSHELTDKVSLTLPDGRLNPEAVGWARQPLVDTGGIGRGRGRNKRWEYWNVMTPRHILALTVSSIDYAAVHEVWVFDRETGRQWHRGATVLPSRGVELPARLESGRSRARAKGLDIAIDEIARGSGPDDAMFSDAMPDDAMLDLAMPDDAMPDVGVTDAKIPGGSEAHGGHPRATRLRARIPGASCDVVATLPAGHERLAVVVPWNERLFQYTVKDLARPASGTLTLDGETIELPAGESWAVLDHGRGRWPYDVRWNWGAGSGRSGGHVVGLQVGGQWTDGTGSTENSIVVDGRLHKIRAELAWEYDPTAPMRPWRVHGGGLDARFEPFHVKETRTNLVVVSARTDQAFGHWSGTFADDGVQVTFEGLPGWAEDVHNRW